MSAQIESSSVPEPAATPELEWTLTRFRLRAQRRALWLRQMWSTEADFTDADAPAAEAAWIAATPEVRQLNDSLVAVEGALRAHTHSRLIVLREMFALDEPEFDLIQACVAVSLDPALARICGLLHGDLSRTYMTADLSSRLYQHGRCATYIPESPLIRWHMVRRSETGPGQPCALTLDLGIREWLRGANHLDEVLRPVAHLHLPRKPLDAWPVEQTARWLKARLGRSPIRSIQLRVIGRPNSGRRTFAAAVAARLGMPLLAISADDIHELDWHTVFVRAQRHAFLQTCALAWCQTGTASRRWPGGVLPFPLQFVISETRPETVATDIHEICIDLPSTRAQDRLEIWRHAAPPGWTEDALQQLASEHRVEVGHIVRVCDTAPVDVHEAAVRVRDIARSSLGEHVQSLPCTFSWGDLVIPAKTRETLLDLLFEAQHRNEWWEGAEAQRLFPQGRGLLALFNGPPGTGKTMAAQVIAGALGHDLLRIDLSSVVSKYVGETSQNLQRILSRAAHMDVVLLFDEADGLFGKRAADVKEAQDKFANTETAHLLQAIEAFPGIAFMASNQKGCIDAAFVRRIRFVVEFATPDSSQRMEIWRRVTQALTGEERAASLNTGLQGLARNVEVTGAQIKNAVLSAVFMAKRAQSELTVGHLLGGLERELAKDGRSLSVKERDRMLAP